MGFGSLLRKVGKGAAALSKSPLGRVAGLVPGLGTAVSAIGLAGSAYGVYKGVTGGGGGGGLPALPGMPGGMVMSAAGRGGAGGVPPPMMGERSIFRDDPNVVEQLKPWAIPTRGLKQYYRAPKGFVVMKDAVGDPYGIPKKMAKAYLGWKPAKKPLLSIRDTSALRRAGTAIKKLQNAEKMARKIANWHTPRRASKPQVLQLPGKMIVGRKAA